LYEEVSQAMEVDRCLLPTGRCKLDSPEKVAQIFEEAEHTNLKMFQTT